MSALESMAPWDAGGFLLDFSGKHLGSRFSEVTIVGNSGRLLR